MISFTLQGGSQELQNCLISHLKKCKYAGGIISHTNNATGAEELNRLIKEELNYNDAVIMKNRGL